MSNSNKETNNSMLIGALIGGVVGALATAIYLSSKDESHECKTSSSALGRIIMQLGESLSSEDMRKTHVTKGVEKNAQKYEDTVSDVLRLVSSGMHLWEKIKRG